MRFSPPEQFNIAEYFLDARIREGRGDRAALLTGSGTLTYRDVQALASRFGHLLAQRVLIALPDGPEFVGALFGTLKLGAVVVMVNPHLKVDAIEYFYGYTRARLAIVHRDTAPAFRAAAERAPHLKRLLIVGDAALEAELTRVPDVLDTFPTHRDDPAIWLFSGGTTGQPKAVVQSHTSFANTTECYAKGVIGYAERDVTLSVPKLFFGYATGSNLFFPFAVGGAAVLFPEPCTAEVIFEKLVRFEQWARTETSSVRREPAGRVVPAALHVRR